MSIVGTSYRDPQEWDADKQEVVRCQNSIESQERTMQRAQAFVKILQDHIEHQTELLQEKKQEFLQKNAQLRTYIDSLTTRMDNLYELKERITQGNNNVANTLQQLIEDKRNATQNGVDWYNEATAQIALMDYNMEYRKFAEVEMNNLRARIQQGTTVDWSANAMQAQAQRLLSDVYRIGLQVIECREQYDNLQKQCTEKAMSILEQAKEFRSKGQINGYSIGSDVDYWTGDALKEVETQVDSILSMIKDNCENPDFNVFKLQCQLNDLSSLAEKKDKIIDCAIENARRSELVQAEVRLAVDTMVNRHDFRLVGANYADGDERKPFIARLKRATDGMEVEFTCGYDATTNQYKLVYSMNNAAYNDINVKATIEQAIAQSIVDAGGRITMNQQCQARALSPFDPKNPALDQHTQTQLSGAYLTYQE